MTRSRDGKGEPKAGREEVLSFILAEERLTKTLRQFGLDRSALTALMMPGKPKKAAGGQPQRTVAPRSRTRGGGRSLRSKGDEGDSNDYVYERLLIYADGASRGNPGEAGAGVVLKTPEGEEVGRFGRYLGRATNNLAEYNAVLLGLEHAREFGARDVTVLSDSELLVRQILGEYRVKASSLTSVFEEVQNRLGEFDRFQVKHIVRDKNAEADNMANRAIDERL